MTAWRGRATTEATGAGSVWHPPFSSGLSTPL